MQRYQAFRNVIFAVPIKALVTFGLWTRYSRSGLRVAVWLQGHSPVYAGLNLLCLWRKAPLQLQFALVAIY